MRKTSIMLAASALFVIFPSVRVHAQTFTTLYTFTGGTDGGGPTGSLITDSQGNLYGVTGLTSTSFGTVFELSPATGGGWTLNTLYTFQSWDDGEDPFGNLVFDNAGNLYGTTADGGGVCSAFGCGTVFELSPNGKGGWQKTKIYQFQGGIDGANPVSGVVIDRAGNLYGTTSNLDVVGYGNVFELSLGADGWTETVLHRFGTALLNGTGLTSPMGGLVLDGNGNLYGTANSGGLYGCGGAFQLSPGTGGWNLHILHAFRCGSDGGYPYDTLALDSMGRIYGTTRVGGAFQGGVLFMLTPRISKGWLYTVIHNFKGPDGLHPSVGVTLDTAGNLYGTTQNGGGSKNCADGCGVAYKLTTTSVSSWTYSTLHVFTGADGSGPSSLVLDGAGNLFATTSDGGPDSVFGTVFEITPN